MRGSRAIKNVGRQLLGPVRSLLAVVLVCSLLLGFFVAVGSLRLTDDDGGWRIVIGPETAQAGVVVDYTCDGVDDDVQFQNALNALPSVGGEIHFLAGNYTFSNTVSRAMDDVTISGNGAGCYAVNDGATALFDAGSQNGWAFKDFATDAGGVDVDSASEWLIYNCWFGTDYVGLEVADDYTGADYEFPTGRGATYVVAASNASAASLAQADYVCDGTNDEVELQAANDAAAGGTVQVMDGTYNIQTSDLMIDNCTMVGQGVAKDSWFTTTKGTVFSLSQDVGIIVKDGGRLHKVGIKVPATYTSGGEIVALTLGATDELLWQIQKILDDVALYKANVETDTVGLKILGDGDSSTGAVSFSSIGHVAIRGFEKQIWFYAEEAVTKEGYVTSINVDSFVLDKGKYPLTFEVDTSNSPQITHNVISKCQIQASSDTVDGVRFIGGSQCHANSIESLAPLDWNLASGRVIAAEAGTYDNYVGGQISDNHQYHYEDLGSNNFFDYAAPDRRYAFYDCISNLLNVLGDCRLLLMCEDVTGTTINDYSLYGHDFTATESVAAFDTKPIQKGKGIMYSFNGTDEYLELADDADFTFGNGAADSAFSVIAVVNFSTNALNRDIITKYNSNANAKEWRIFTDGSGYLTFETYDMSASAQVGEEYQVALSTSTNYVLIGTYGGGGSGDFNLYVNGPAVATAATDNGVYVAMEDLTSAIDVCCLTGAGGTRTNFLKGLGATFIVTAKELSVAEAWQITQILKGYYAI